MIGQTLLPTVIAPTPRINARFTGFSDHQSGYAQRRQAFDEAFFEQLKKTMADSGDVLGKAFVRAVEPLLAKMTGGSAQQSPLGPSRFDGFQSYLNRPIQTGIPGIAAIQDMASTLKTAANLATSFGQATKGLEGIAGTLGSIARVAGPAGVALTSGVQFVTKIVATADRVRQEQRQYAYASPNIAANYIQSDMRKFLRDLTHGENIAGSNRRLNESLDALATQMQPIQESLDNLKNNVLASVIELLNQGIEIAKDKIPGLKDFLKRPHPANMPQNAAWLELAIRGEQNEKLHNGLKPWVAGLPGVRGN